MKMRAGKTKVAIDIMCHHFDRGHIQQLLWLCPNSTIKTAQEQWGKYAVIDHLPIRFVSLETISGCGHKRYEELLTWFNDYTGIIVDESQMIKNSRAKRSRRLQDLFCRSAVRGILSGTPITKNIQDIYNQARCLHWKILGYRSYNQFADYHLVLSDKIPGLIQDVVNVDYLVKRFKPFAYEYFDDNSQQEENSRVIDMSPAQQKLVAMVKDSFIARLSSFSEQRGDVYRFFTTLQSILTGYVPRDVIRYFVRSIDTDVYLYTPKLDAIKSIINEREGKLLIWCTRRYEIECLKMPCPEATTISGAQNAAQRHSLVQAFRKSESGVMIAMLHVAKYGIEISECDDVVFYSHTFDYEARLQAQYRTLLQDKQRVCRYTNLIYDRSLDVRMLQGYDKKHSVIKYFLDLLKEQREQAILEIKDI